MDCERARSEAFEETPTGDAARGHLASCERCRIWLDDERLIRALRSEAVPAPTPDFVDRALRQATRQAPRRRFGSRGLAAAAVLTAAVGLALLAVRDDRQTAEPHDAHAVRTPPQIVNVVIDAKDDRWGALVRVELSEDLELDGFDSQRSMEWHTDLPRGRNLLALPVRSKAGRGGAIRVALSYADRPDTELTIAVDPG